MLKFLKCLQLINFFKKVKKVNIFAFFIQNFGTWINLNHDHSDDENISNAIIQNVCIYLLTF